MDRLNKLKWERNKRVPGLSKVGTGYRVQVVQYTTYTTLQQCLYLVLFHCRGEEIKPRQQTSNPTERQWNVMEFKFWCHSVMSWWPGVTKRSPRWCHPWQALSYLKGVDVYLFLPERGWCVSDRSERIEGWLPPKPFSFLFRYTSFLPTYYSILSAAFYWSFQLFSLTYRHTWTEEKRHNSLLDIAGRYLVQVLQRQPLEPPKGLEI